MQPFTLKITTVALTPLGLGVRWGFLGKRDIHSPHHSFACSRILDLLTGGSKKGQLKYSSYLSPSYGKIIYDLGGKCTNDMLASPPKARPLYWG